MPSYRDGHPKNPKLMQKKPLYAMLLLAGAFAFTACSDDNESNPTITQPSAFSIFEPAVGKANIDLQKSQSIQLTWSIPNYTDFGAPVVPTYVVQASPTGSFTKEFDREAKDNAGADYIVLEQTFNSTSGDINAEGLNQSMQLMLGWDKEDDVPAALPVTFRVVASIRDASSRDYFPITSSNTVQLNTVPYYIVNMPPVVWYMVGNNIGSASWSNDASSVGTGLIPLLPSSDEEYDKATGTGVISYTGFMTAGTQFKFVRTPGDWGSGDTSVSPRMQLHYQDVDSPDAALISDEDGDNHNIGIRADGYYVISLNTKSLKVTIAAYEKQPKTFATMSMPGDYNSWSMDNHMTACETLSGESHIWMAQFAPEAEGGVKFAANDDWADNWGAEAFPYATGVGGGANIPYTAGSYTVFFNDITGQYYFIANQ